MPDTPTITWILPVVTLLIGYGTKSLSDWVQFRRETSRARETREAERTAKLFERRNDLQRQSLLELQEAVMQLARATGAINHQDSMAFRASGEWQKQCVTGEFSEGFRVAQTRALMLTVRIRDEQVRTLTEKFRTDCTSVVHSQSEAAGSDRMAQAMLNFEELNQRIGELLRTLDNDI